MNVKNRPTLSEGTYLLLQVARENDRHRALERNAALLTVLAFARDLINVCHQRGLTGMSALLDTPTPSNFLTITAAALHEIRKRVDAYAHGDAPTALLVRDFDRHAFQSFAQALADVAWPDRDARDFDGPSAETIVRRIARTDLNALWRCVLQNYLGNIFQDYFVALRVRENLPHLDKTTEVDLRSVDAGLVADYAMMIYTSSSSDDHDPALLGLALYEAIRDTLTH